MDRHVCWIGFLRLLADRGAFGSAADPRGHPGFARCGEHNRPANHYRLTGWFEQATAETIEPANNDQRLRHCAGCQTPLVVNVMTTRTTCPTCKQWSEFI